MEYTGLTSINIETRVRVSGGEFISLDPQVAGDSTVSHSEVTHSEEGNYVLLDICSWGDSSGSTYNRANYVSFIRDFGDLPGVIAVTGWGSYSVAISKYWLLATDDEHEMASSIQEAVSNMKYDVLDDTVLYDIEWELEDEVMQDLVREARREFFIYGRVGDGEIEHYLRGIMQEHDIYCEFESAVSGYIREEEVFKYFKMVEWTNRDEDLENELARIPSRYIRL